MALKNFFLEKTGLGVRWLVWKSPFVPFLTQTWTHILAPKSPIWNSLNRILIFNLLERQKLYYYQVCNLIFTISSNKHLHTYISVICWKSIYCYWSFCPRGHWDPGCVSNWFVYLSTISFVYLMSLVRLLVSGWLSFWLAHHFV